MENLENIVFTRFRNFLVDQKFDIDIDYRVNRYRILCNKKQIPTLTWKSKKNIFFSCGQKEYTLNSLYSHMSIFEVSKRFYFQLKNPLFKIEEKRLGQLWPKLQTFQGDSFEEIAIKMDLAGI